MRSAGDLNSTLVSDALLRVGEATRGEMSAEVQLAEYQSLQPWLNSRLGMGWTDKK